MSSLSGSQDVTSQFNIQDFVDLSPQVIANKINEAFLEAMQPFRPLECSPVTDEVTISIRDRTLRFERIETSYV